MNTRATLYDQDFYAWLQRQAALLKARQFDALDLEHLVEEVESLAAQEHRLLGHRLEQLVTHLYTWWWNVPERSIRWQSVISHQRYELEDILESSPSLQAELPVLLAQAYAHLCKTTLREFPETSLPAECPWTPAQVLDIEFMPEDQTLEQKE
jgi:hypothetical protein